jgi:hypothetical protein
MNAKNLRRFTTVDIDRRTDSFTMHCLRSGMTIFAAHNLPSINCWVCRRKYTVSLLASHVRARQCNEMLFWSYVLRLCMGNTKCDPQKPKPLKWCNPNLAYVTRLLSSIHAKFGVVHVTVGAAAIWWFVKLLICQSRTSHRGVRSSPLVAQTMCFDSRTCLAYNTSINSWVMGSSRQKIGDFIAWKELCQL